MKNEKITFNSPDVCLWHHSDLGSKASRDQVCSEKEPVVSCVFTYTNVGEQNLIINQAIASCGCTVPEYTRTPIKPGEQGIIKVTYNGAGKFPGHFKKSITVRTNGAVEMTRLYVEGEMTEAK